MKFNFTFLIPFLCRLQVSLNRVLCHIEAEDVFGRLAEGTVELFAPQMVLCCDSVHEECSINYQYEY